MNEWTMQEAGWWTSPLGAVCKEANGQWECYIDGEGYPPVAGFLTLREAKKWVDENGNEQSKTEPK